MKRERERQTLEVRYCHVGKRDSNLLVNERDKEGEIESE